MTEELKKLVNEAYKLFSKYSASVPLDVCTVCCVTKEEESELVHNPLKKLPLNLLRKYHISAKSTQPDLIEWKYFLPRFLESISNNQFPGFDPESSLSRNEYYSKEDWESEEWSLIQNWGNEYFKFFLNTYPLPETDYIDSYILLFYKGRIDIQQLLNFWASNITKCSILHFSDLINFGYDNYELKILASPYSDEIISDIIYKWIISEEVKRRFSKGLLNVLQGIDLNKRKIIELECTYSILQR
ncbi:MAG: hypothetical protein BalsKO_13300 [Balneolaceae bacterium]